MFTKLTSCCDFCIKAIISFNFRKEKPKQQRHGFARSIWQHGRDKTQSSRSGHWQQCLWLTHVRSLLLLFSLLDFISSFSGVLKWWGRLWKTISCICQTFTLSLFVFSQHICIRHDQIAGETCRSTAHKLSNGRITQALHDLYMTSHTEAPLWRCFHVMWRYISSLYTGTGVEILFLVKAHLNFYNIHPY